VSLSLADYLPNELGVCPGCHAVVPFLFANDHSRWHTDREERAPGPLVILRDLLP
jgi:hypothetical protein